MGFRSTFTTEDCGIIWPDWFVEKYYPFIWFNDEKTGLLAAKGEAKTYGAFMSLHEDIQKAICWEGFGLPAFVLVYLHECGGITRCHIERDAIKWTEPSAWRSTNGVTHSYCYDCSDADKVKSPKEDDEAVRTAITTNEFAQMSADAIIRHCQAYGSPEKEFIELILREQAEKLRGHAG